MVLQCMVAGVNLKNKQLLTTQKGRARGLNALDSANER